MSKPDLVTPAQTHFVRDHCLCLATQRAARALSRRFDEAFRAFGITSGQFSLLNALNRPMPPSMGAVAELLAMDRTSLTANLKPLQRNDLVVMAVDASDRRIKRVALTAAGKRVLAEALPVWTRVHAEVDIGLAFREASAATLRTGLAALI